MRNRAKCKKCQTVIESLHTHDYVMCKCGEIAVDGGDQHFRVMAKDYDNFLRLDDEGNEIVVRVIEKPDAHEEQKKDHKENFDTPPVITKKELLDMLDTMGKNIEKLPQAAMSLPITHADHYSLIILLSSIFKA